MKLLLCRSIDLMALNTKQREKFIEKKMSFDEAFKIAPGESYTEIEIEDEDIESEEPK